MASPGSGFRLKEDDYAKIGAAISSLSLPAIVVQEGGYCLEAVPDLVVNFLRGISGVEAGDGQA